MKFIPELIFNGNCVEALNYYKTIFNGEIVQIVTYDEAVVNYNENDADKVFSAVLVIGKNTLYFKDVLFTDKIKSRSNLAIMIEFFNEKDLRTIFEKIAEDGEIIQNLIESNWGSIYGTIEDKYGFVWSFNFEILFV